MLERDLAIGGVSVCPSVCLLHAGIDSKLMIAGLCGFHCWVTQRHWFWCQLSHPRSQGNLLRWLKRDMEG